MKRIKLLLLFAAIFCCGQTNLFGQGGAEPEQFDCYTSGMILTQGNGLTGVNARTTFYYVNTATNPISFDVMFVVNYNLNSTAYNVLDNCLYAFPNGATTPLLRIDAAGNVTTFIVQSTPTAPKGNGYKGGTIDNNGIYYLAAANTDNRLFYIDLKSLSATSPNYTTKAIPLTGGGDAGNINLPDLSWNPANGLLYGVEYGAAGQLDKVTIITLTGLASGVITRVGPAKASVVAGDAFGATYIGSNGVFYGSRNGGNFYQIDPITGVKFKLGSAPTSEVNDGANCPLAPITFGTDIQVTKTNGISVMAAGTSTTYTIVVFNAGPFGASNIKVSDPLPNGIPSANVSYTASATVGAVTAVSGTQYGAILDIISLETGASVIYTVIMKVPETYDTTIKLINTVTAMVDANSTYDTNPSNNTATDITDVKPTILPVNPHLRGKFNNNQ